MNFTNFFQKPLSIIFVFSERDKISNTCSHPDSMALGIEQ